MRMVYNGPTGAISPDAKLNYLAGTGVDIGQPGLKRKLANVRGVPMNREKPKAEVDKELDEALKETFPGSDAIAVDSRDDGPVRPANRKPPIIDKALVNKLAEEAKAKKD